MSITDRIANRLRSDSDPDTETAPPVEFPRRPIIRERNQEHSAMLPPPPSPVESMSDMLHRIAREEANTPEEVRGFAPSSIRALAKMANEIADEHGIAQPTSAGDPVIEYNPLKDLAAILTGFTYGTMMQFANELKTTEGAVFDTPEGIAALLHKWASKTAVSTPPKSV